MFDWKKDLDILKNGAEAEGGFEFRIVESLDKRNGEGFGDIREKLRMIEEAKKEQEHPSSSKSKKAGGGGCVVS
jgi:hypothetical protein